MIRLCERCEGPRPGGRGRRHCDSCAVIRKHETQEEAMKRFVGRSPGYWQRYWKEHKRRLG